MYTCRNFILRFERRFGLPKVLRQSCSPDSCTSPAITFRISVFAHFVYTCRMPFLFIISMSWVSRWVCGKCTQNGQSVAGRGVRPECRDHGPGARIPCPKDRFRRRLSPRASVTVCNCRLSPRTYHTGPQPPAVDLPGPRCGLDVNTSRAQGREVGHCGTRNSSQVLWTGVDSPRRTWPTPSGRREPVLFTATAAPPRWLREPRRLSTPCAGVPRAGRELLPCYIPGVAGLSRLYHASLS